MAIGSIGRGGHRARVLRRVLRIAEQWFRAVARVGERDTDCPAAQSREMWQALAALGVPTELVVYPGEAHGFSQPVNRRDRLERMVTWFDRHMPP